MTDDRSPASSSASPIGDLADEVAEAVLAAPGVHALHGGAFGEVATYLPGRRVAGVRIRDTGCDVHVTVDWGASVHPTAAAIRASVRRLVAGAVDVTIEDVAPRGGPT